MAEKSISASNLADEVHAAVKKLNIKNVKADAEIIVHPPWICGFIYDPWLDSKPGELQQLSANITNNMASAKGGAPAVVITGEAGTAAASQGRLAVPGHCIIGFIRDPALVQK